MVGCYNVLTQNFIEKKNTSTGKWKHFQFSLVPFAKIHLKKVNDNIMIL